MPTYKTEVWVSNGAGLLLRRSRTSRGAALDRNSLIYGNYKPDGTTAGVLPGVARTNYNAPGTTGNVFISTNGATYSNLDFYGDVQVSGPNNVFNNCYFHGDPAAPASSRGCVTMYNSNNHTGTVFNDCTADAQFPHYNRDGWQGFDYTCNRCEAKNVNDGFGVYGNANSSVAFRANVGLYGCYVHDLVYYDNDGGAHTDGSHNDCVQFQGGDLFTMRGCNLVGSSWDVAGPNPKGSYLNGQCLMLNQTTAIATNITIDKNWFSKGGAGINMAFNGRATWDATITSNKFDRDVYDRDTTGTNPDKWYVVVNNGGTGVNWTGLYPTNTDNRFTDNNALLAVGRVAGIRVF